MRGLPDDVSNVGATPVGISNANCTRRANVVNSDLEPWTRLVALYIELCDRTLTAGSMSSADSNVDLIWFH